MAVAVVTVEMRKLPVTALPEVLCKSILDNNYWIPFWGRRSVLSSTILANDVTCRTTSIRAKSEWYEMVTVIQTPVLAARVPTKTAQPTWQCKARTTDRRTATHVRKNERWVSLSHSHTPASNIYPKYHVGRGNLVPPKISDLERTKLSTSKAQHDY